MSFADHGRSTFPTRLCAVGYSGRTAGLPLVRNGSTAR
jgi:hypothetical protein